MLCRHRLTADCGKLEKIRSMCTVTQERFVWTVAQVPAGQPATEARPGLATVHCCSRVLSTVEFRGATTSLQK